MSTFGLVHAQYREYQDKQESESSLFLERNSIYLFYTARIVIDT